MRVHKCFMAMLFALIAGCAVAQEKTDVAVLAEERHRVLISSEPNACSVVNRRNQRETKQVQMEDMTIQRSDLSLFFLIGLFEPIRHFL